MYLDDINIHSKTFKVHLGQLRAVFTSLRSACLKIKPSKGHLFQKRVKYLDHTISEAGIVADPEKIQTATSWHLLTTVYELYQVLGFFGNYRRFVNS